MKSKLARACAAALCAAAVLGSSQLAVGVANPEGLQGADRDHNYDARIALIDQQGLQSRALATPAMSGRGVIANIQEMIVEANDITGAVGSMSNATGFLTDAQAGEPMAIAMDFVKAN